MSNANPQFQHTIQPIRSIQPNPGDGSDGVNIDEFVQGCYRLSGEATTLHTQVTVGTVVSQLWSPMVLGWLWAPQNSRGWNIPINFEDFHLWRWNDHTFDAHMDGEMSGMHCPTQIMMILHHISHQNRGMVLVCESLPVFCFRKTPG